MFYLSERNNYDRFFFIYKLEYFFIFSNIFKMLESNPMYNKKKPFVKISFFFFCNIIIDFFCLGGALLKGLLYEKSRTLTADEKLK